MKTDTLIRNARFEDMDTLVSLLGQLFSIEADFDVDPAVQRRGVKLMLDGCGKHRCMKVAEVNKTVVGMATVQLLVSTAEGAMAGLVEDLVVDGAFQNQGIGRSLMRHIETWAMNHGATRLQLLADQTNMPALDFYQHMGWTRTRLMGLRRKWHNT